MASPITLFGITWNHTRGFVPMVATAQHWTDKHPEVTISWQTRSLKDFGEFPIERLIENFDLLIIDHPFAGYASANNVLLPLDELLPPDFLVELAANQVGVSCDSYIAGGHLWALPVDAATPIAGWRADLLTQHDASVPQTWDDLLALAHRGLVAVPAAAVDALMHIYMLCIALGEEPFLSEEQFVAEPAGLEALTLLQELIAAAGPENIDRNPIRTWEALSRGDTLAYCPFAYGYANYGQQDYTANRLTFGAPVTFNGLPLRTTLGGTGLAISSRCQHPEIAAAYAGWVMSEQCQRGLYTRTGGQPGHRAAWTDPALDQFCNGFFSATLATHDAAYLRPRYAGYIPFQEEAGFVIRDFLRDDGDAGETLRRINDLYQESLGRG